ncbi:histidinol-phosphate transaminase [Clostridium cellulovorans]|uniref:Histidinol-phosphate aminotransferase n=1 Tax=Clostridium cellulovorans (strain ATCC 35296 / DSM 3052 / OCM 3 / 743B) TaxID=573061 RepID=D9SUB0_CLOC7|nr:histidinol-phosphate transaminase [Clostridium cellulovorans]ADL52865.1 histidinol-phosphate aminotransferase [Clostridium cellulovorans 743B]
MSKYWSEITKKIEPYVPGEQPKDRKYIKLNTNENPYPPSPKVIEAINKEATDCLQLYPEPNCDDLRATVAKYYNLSPNQIFVGNGSDEVLAFSFMTFFNKEKPVLFADITYSFYEVYVQLFELNHKLIPLKDDFSLPVEDFITDNAGIVIANPNAPTSKPVEIDDLKRILEINKNTVVIVDEAYVDFGGTSVINLIDSYPNLLVVQTLSKSRSLAGLRVGFAFGHADLIDGLNRVKNSFNSYTIDRLAAVGAKAAFEDVEYFDTMCNKVIRTRERILPELEKLGFTVLESKTNFFFVSHKEMPAEEIFKELRANGILVRFFNKPKINNFLRISIGTDKEMDTLVETLKKIINK